MYAQLLSQPLSISVVVLSFNRKEALRNTLTHIAAQPWSAGAQLIVVDNASADGSAAMVSAEFPRVQLIALARNVLIDGFNIGAAAAVHDLLLILDDDSWPQDGAIEAATAYLLAHNQVGGIMLHRRHPQTMQYEWPFEASTLTGVQTQWPDMGCGNLYRRAAWQAVGGYEHRYELYRNDTDIALKLLAAGHDVVFCRDWLVWHDSKIASRKSDRWLALSTRNWVWMARRHARGMLRLRGIVLGWLHAHRLAGLRPSGHISVLRGVLQGALKSAPQQNAALSTTEARQRSADAYAKLLRLKMRMRC